MRPALPRRWKPFFGCSTRLEASARLFGDPGSDLQGVEIPIGESIITFDLYSENRLKGDFLGSISRSFTIIDPNAAADDAAPPTLDDLV